MLLYFVFQGDNWHCCTFGTEKYLRNGLLPSFVGGVCFGPVTPSVFTVTVDLDVQHKVSSMVFNF